MQPFHCEGSRKITVIHFYVTIFYVKISSNNIVNFHMQIKFVLEVTEGEGLDIL